MNIHSKQNKIILAKYIPANSIDLIVEWIYRFNFKLKIKRSRLTKRGDYRAPLQNKNHQISVNHDLNEYAFLITLVHEVAHLTTWELHKNKVKPHGEEWKNEFKVLMQHFMNETIFPADVILALQNYLKNPAASSCSDLSLLRTLKKYDTKQEVTFVEDLPLNTLFKIKSEQHFIKGERIRKRYKCKEIKSNKFYLFSPLCEVILVNIATENTEKLNLLPA